MNKLFGAGFTRIIKDKTFRIEMLFMATLGVLMPVMRYMDAKRSGYTLTLDTCFFSYALFIVIVSSVFCSLFTGTEYADGTIRNKLVVGHGRCAVYGANLLLCAAAVLLLQAAYILPALAVGLPLLGLAMGAGSFLFLILCILMMSLSFTALFALVAMLCQSKPVTAVMCILGAFLLLFAGVYIDSRLGEPETYDAYSYSDSTGVTEEQEQPNPNYLTGTKREVYAFLHDFLPGGQTVQLAGASAAHPERLLLYALAVILLSTAAGMWCFYKKDVK